MIWGAYHGVLLALHKLFSGATRSEGWRRTREHVAYQAFALVGTLLLVMVGWVFFRAQTWAMQSPSSSASTWHSPFRAGSRAPCSTRQHGVPRGARRAAFRGRFEAGLRTTRVLPAAARGIMWAGMVLVLYWFATTSPTFIYFYF